ncbi:hypothetical protein SKAU_G00288040 [Synaphobranchus kaupii]|uniref:Uncharacterized protein n=1 Tax=Synaphobranchus kaupii TaxID=118154 RepID=A0A9Q1EYA9_SYNKA|nr:hypothetical protein SKAU_G00288040 [Synaphobranchus kaupii]
MSTGLQRSVKRTLSPNPLALTGRQAVVVETAVYLSHRRPPPHPSLCLGGSKNVPGFDPVRNTAGDKRLDGQCGYHGGSGGGIERCSLRCG